MDVNYFDRGDTWKHFRLYYCSLCIRQYWLALGPLHLINSTITQYFYILFDSRANSKLEKIYTQNTRVPKENKNGRSFTKIKFMEDSKQLWFHENVHKCHTSILCGNRHSILVLRFPNNGYEYGKRDCIWYIHRCKY